MGAEGKNMNGSKRGTQLIKNDSFPEFMLLEVLSRLPLKVLFKFKVVSKRWLSMISDPCFARMYIARKSQSQPHSQQPWTRISILVDMDTIKHVLGQKLSLYRFSLGINFPQQRATVLHIITGISNGIVLYGTYSSEDDVFCGYVLCNPITGQRITLPPCDGGHGIFSTGFVTKVEDNVLVSYRVVGRIDNGMTPDSICRFVVYFSEIGSWADFIVDFNQEIYFLRKKQAALGEIIHWMVRRHRIMAYDPYNKPDSFRLISLPGVDGGNDTLFDEHQGRLRYFESELNGQSRRNQVFHGISIWILNDYDSGEWCMQHRITIDGIQCDNRLMLSVLPLFFHPFDPDIVYFDNGYHFYSLNVKTRKVEAVDDSENYLQIACLSSFLYVLPAWPISI